jgi:hypothetical protein
MSHSHFGSCRNHFRAGFGLSPRRPGRKTIGVKSTHASLVVSALLLGLVGACATSTASDDTTGLPDAGHHDTGLPKYDGGAGQDTAGQVCVSMCATDNDCQTSCPTPDSGIQCCDMSTGVCYVEAQMCQAPTNDGGLE